jgi:hypothetical protein
MGILLSIKNIWKFIKEGNLIFLILTISQLIAVIIICFVYGIFTNYQVEKEELNIQAKELNVYFSDSHRGTIVELRECMPKILTQVEERLDYFFIAGRQEGEMVMVHNGYDNGNFFFPESLKDNLSIKEGRMFSEEDIKNGENVIIGLNVGNVGELYKFGNQEYEVIGIPVKPYETDMKEIEISYLACPEQVEIAQIVWNFKELPTQTDYLTIKDAMTEVFGDRVSLDEFEVKDVEAIITINSVMTYSVIVSIVIALDTCLLYGYLLYRRKKQTAVYALAGAKKHTILIMNLFEIMLVSIITLFIGLVVFYSWIESIVLNMFDNEIEIYTPVIYGKLSGIYIGMIFGFTLILTIIFSCQSVVNRLKSR